MDLLLDVVLDSLKDSVELVPFLLATYLVLELLEHASGGVTERVIARAGTAGPVVGAVLGALPQCGFSAMAATLFSGGIVTVGTLVAVILSTSDELIPVFLAEGAVGRLGALVVGKVVVGLIVGMLLDIALRTMGRSVRRPRVHDLCDEAGHAFGDETWPVSDGMQAGIRHASGHAHGHAHGHAGGVRWGHVLHSALTHTAQVSVFIFLCSLVLGLVIEGVGEDALAGMLSAHPVRSTLLAGLVGLIPNCGASVVIAQLFLDGSLASGPMVAGLLASGGVGTLVLFRTNQNLRQNVGIIMFVYLVSVMCGLVVSASGIVI